MPQLLTHNILSSSKERNQSSQLSERMLAKVEMSEDSRDPMPSLLTHTVLNSNIEREKQ